MSQEKEALLKAVAAMAKVTKAGKKLKAGIEETEEAKEETEAE